MISNLLHRCFIESFVFAENRYRITYFRSLSVINLLDKVQKSKQITSDEASFLKRKKLIEGKRPNLHISSDVAQITDQRDDYIKLRGIDDTYCQSIILEYLGKFKSGTRTDFEKILLDKLPDVLDENQKKIKLKTIFKH